MDAIAEAGSDVLQPRLPEQHRQLEPDVVVHAQLIPATGVQALDKGRKREGKAKVKAAMKPLQANDQDVAQEPDDE